jgi:hypothetical protein
MGEWRYSSTILDLDTRWSGQLHAPAALSPGKKPPVPVEEEAGRTPEPVWQLWSREKRVAPAGSRTLPSSHGVMFLALQCRFLHGDATHTTGQ